MSGRRLVRNLPHRAHRPIGTITGAILAIWLAVTAAGGIVATLKTFVIIGLIAMAVVIVVWLGAVPAQPPACTGASQVT